MEIITGQRRLLLLNFINPWSAVCNLRHLYTKDFMKTLKRLHLTTLSIFLSSALQLTAPTVQAQAELTEGGGGTGGGGTHVCFKSDGQGDLILKKGKPVISSIEFYDLFEAKKVRRNYKVINPGNLTANQLLNEAMKKIYEESPLYAYQILSNLKAYSEMKEVNYNKKFNIIGDANIVFTNNNCEYREIAQWRDQYEKVFINGNLTEIFNRSPLNIAGLALHESIYKFERTHFNATTSDHTREVVGQSFSDKKLTLIPKAFLDKPTPALHRNTQDPFHLINSAIVLKNNSDRLYLRFTLLTKNQYSDQLQIYVSSLEYLPNMCQLKDSGSTCGFPIEKISNFKPIELNISSNPKYFCMSCPLPNDEMPEVKVEIFDNAGNKLFDEQVKLELSDLRSADNHYESVPNGKAHVGRFYYQATSRFITVPTYDKGIEPEVQSLDINLK